MEVQFIYRFLVVMHILVSFGSLPAQAQGGNGGGGNGNNPVNICSPDYPNCRNVANFNDISHPRSCTKFFECRGNSVHERQCDDGEVFNHTSKTCSPTSRCEILCEQVICNKPIKCGVALIIEKMISHPADCTKYFLCNNGQTFLEDCDPGEHFDERDSSCKPIEDAQCTEECIEGQTTMPAVSRTEPTTPTPTPTTTPSTTPVTVTTADPQTPTPTTAPPVTETPTPPAKTTQTTNKLIPITIPTKGDTLGNENSTPKTEVTTASNTQGQTPIPTKPPVTQQPTDSQGPQTTANVTPNPPTTVGKTEADTTVPTTVVTEEETIATSAPTTLPPLVTVPQTPDPPTSADTLPPTTPAPTTTATHSTMPKVTPAVTPPPTPRPTPDPPSTQQPTHQPTPPTRPTNPTTASPPGTDTPTPTTASPVPVTSGTPASPITVAPTQPTTVGAAPPTTVAPNPPTTNLPDVTSEDFSEVVTTSPEIQLSLTQRTADILEGLSAEFGCHINITPDQLPGLRFVWELKQVQAKHGGRVVIKRSQDSGGILSTLTLKRMTPRDSGTLVCTLKSGATTIAMETLDVQVLGLPDVTINPHSAIVNQGSNVTIICEADIPKTNHPKANIPPTFYWYKNDEFVYTSEEYRSELTLTPQERLTVSCTASNDAGSSKIASAVVNIRAPMREAVYCEAEDVEGFNWERTQAGGEVFQSCTPLSAQGEARRECIIVRNEDDRSSEEDDQVTVNWSTPDYSRCITQEFQELLDKVSDAENTLGPISDEILAKIATEIADLTETRPGDPPLIAGDVIAAVDVMNTIADIREDQTEDEEHSGNQTVTVTEIQGIISTASNLLADTNFESWNNVNMESPFASVDIMRILEQYADMLASQLTEGQNRTLTYDNVVLMVEAISKTNAMTVTFPQNLMRMPDWARDGADSISLDSKTLANIKDDVPGDVFTVIGTYYKNIEKILPAGISSVNSKVLSLSIYGLDSSRTLDPPVDLFFSTQEVPSGSNLTQECGFWNFSIHPKGAWSRAGCESVYNEDEGTVSCKCNHLTNFAVLVSSGPVSAKHHKILSLISLVGTIISIVCLLLTIIFYAFSWKAMKSHHAAVLLNLCIALLIGNVLFVAGVNRTENEMACTIIAALLHYFWLAAFCIMLVEGIQLLLYIIYVFHVRRKRDTAALLFGGWMFPAIIVGVSLAITQLEGYGTDEVCWLSVDSGLLWAFVAPVLLIIFINLIILIIVLRRALSAKIPSAKKKNKLRSAVWNIVVITPLLGVTWVFGVFAVNEDTIWFQYIFAVFNSVQGLFIFVFHALLNKKKGRYSLGRDTTPSSNNKKTLSAQKSIQSTKSSKSGSQVGLKQNGVKPPNMKSNNITPPRSQHPPGQVYQNGHQQVSKSKQPSKDQKGKKERPSILRLDLEMPRSERPFLHSQLSEGSELVCRPDPSAKGVPSVPERNSHQHNQQHPGPVQQQQYPDEARLQQEEIRSRQLEENHLESFRNPAAQHQDQHHFSEQQHFQDHAPYPQRSPEEPRSRYPDEMPIETDEVVAELEEHRDVHLPEPLEIVRRQEAPGHHHRAEARLSTVSSNLPPSPTTTTTDISWTSDKDLCNNVRDHTHA